MSNCEPATTIIQICGGNNAVAEALGVWASAPSRWRNPISKGGTGGTIPRKYHDRIIELARQRGADLPRGAFVDPALAQTAHDLIQRPSEDAAA